MPVHNGRLPKVLPGGLVLRQATREDADRLARYNAFHLRDPQSNEPDAKVSAWTHDLLSRPHPTLQPGDFTVVEDPQSGEIVSSLNIIPQIWRYAGIPFRVGRPELVSTHPDYRQRGLVRAQFEVIHRWGAERGELVQAITGIPNFYRRFEYEMAVNLGGGRTGYRHQMPPLKPGEMEPFQVRPLQMDDLPYVERLYMTNSTRSLLCCERDQAIWRYELASKSPENINRRVLRLIIEPHGEPVGFIAHYPELRPDGSLIVTWYDVSANLWSAVTPSVLRYLRRTGEAYAQQYGTAFSAYTFYLGSEHPVYHVIPDRLPQVRKPYAWYLRVPDLPAFIRAIRPVLEQRLAVSPFATHSNELRITFYRQGLRLKLDSGRLEAIAPWQPAPQAHSGAAGFPGLTFLQLIFGYRSLAELQAAFPDCWTEDETVQGVLETLFPKLVSDIWPVS